MIDNHLFLFAKIAKSSNPTKFFHAKSSNPTKIFHAKSSNPTKFFYRNLNFFSK